MTEQVPILESGGHSFSAMIISHPWLTATLLFTTVCLVTRLRTGWQARTTNKPGSREVPMVPYWIPWLGHTIPYVLGQAEYLNRLEKQIPGGAFALRIGGGTHNFITSPSLVKEIFNRPGIPTSTELFTFYVMKNVFGDHGTIEEICTTSQEGRDYIWDGAHKTLSGMMREPFLSRATSATTGAVEDQTWNLVSGNPSWVDQALWERVAKVDITSVSSNGNFVAEADLYVLLRDWISQIATSLIFGRAFMENNPNIVADLWAMDGGFNGFLLGLPYWLVPGLAPAHAARERLIEAVREHHEAMIKIREGKDPGSKYDDLSDVPQFMWERLDMLVKAGASPRCYAASNFTVLWAMNINANQVVFWMVFYLFSQPELLASIRTEISPFVKLRKPEATGLPLGESPKLDIDLQGLMNKAPLLKGVMAETMRLEVASSPYKSVTQDFTVTESEEDARLAGRPHGEIYTLRKGEMICLPGKVHQDSATYFPDPEKFDAKRFWAASKAEKGEAEVTFDYQTMRIWGGGKTMCKGRNFAEREVMIFVAAILMCWEIEPVDKSIVMENGRWKHPGRRIVTGTAIPKKDIRVKMRRRTGW